MSETHALRRTSPKDGPSENDAKLVSDVEEALARATHPNSFDWYYPWRVVPCDGKPTIVGAKSGNLFRGYIGTWQEADLVVALVNAAPRLIALARLAALSSLQDRGGQG